MQLTVSARVMSGFAAVVVLACIIYAVALTGNITIGGSVQKVSKQSVPTLIAGNNMLQSVLLAQLSLVQLEKASTSSQVRGIKNEYDKQKSTNKNAIQQLQELTQPIDEINVTFKQSRELNNAFFMASDKAFSDVVRVVTLAQKTAELASEFGDMGDETLSYAYDLDGLSDDETISDVVNSFVENVENLVDEVNTGLASNIKFEVLNVQSVAKDTLDEMDSQFATIRVAPGIAGTEQVATMADNFASFKGVLIGTESALAARVNTLSEKEKVGKGIQSANESANKLQMQLKELNERIITLTDEAQSEAKLAIEESQTVTTSLTVVMVILSILIAYYVINSIRGPLYTIIDLINRAAKGDLTVQFSDFKKDEFGQLADNMQKLITSLASILREVSNNSQVLASTAEQTNIISEQSCSSAAQQSDQMTSMSSSISQMKETVSSVTNSIHETLEHVKQASSEASCGEQRLQNNVAEIKELEASIEKSANAISMLSSELDNINSVLAVIRSIAEQTNLLALNAAIEAARAGEQGRGFAVVADEVRTLASRAQNATEEIEKAISGLQEGARDAVTTMSTSQKETQACVEGIESVKDTLVSIVGSVETIKDMSQQIAAASEEQSLAAMSQYENVQHMHEITELTSNHAKENQQASRQLAEMAETLRAMMSQFKT
ncbi:methyl-accepting chemotaxis protein [Pseudoalteromonas luteoviolacea]|uniref:methyl-accepting chemotaxis protein n=1 Tax=Pseudoalteromonas luteoviolacea TaxID=43657 RepID=UPI001150C2A8|nr:methyl-accepting chemotaxis protein [Pseudoalteromonas luteoviolacea]TQF71435.1 methyl-accepting chemotaxis protein [Pseudoalteromonas luteoviolacea]